MEMSRAPFASRKPKKEKLEEPPVIRGTPVEPREIKPVIYPEATKAGIVVPEDATEVLLRLQGKPEKTLTPDTVTHEGFMELIRRVPKPPPLPVIRATQPRPAEVNPATTVTFTKPATTDHIKLGPGDTTLWRDAVRPPQEGATTRIPQAPPSRPGTVSRVEAIPTKPKVEMTADAIRRLTRTLEDKEK